MPRTSSFNPPAASPGRLIACALPTLWLSSHTCRTAIAGGRDALAETGSVELG